MADRLENEWRERRASTPIDVVMRFSDEGLVLGAGVVLARAGRSARTIEIDIGAAENQSSVPTSNTSGGTV